MDAPMKFKAGNVNVAELSAKMLKPRNEISAGSLKHTIEFAIDIDDDNKRNLKAVAAIAVEGIDKKNDEKAFSISVKMECQYRFENEIPENEDKKSSFVRMVCEPLYHRASLLIEQTARDLGFSAVRLGTSFPSGDFEMIDEPSDQTANSAPKKTKRKAPTKK